jgi:hypothetical protein
MPERFKRDDVTGLLVSSNLSGGLSGADDEEEVSVIDAKNRAPAPATALLPTSSQSSSSSSSQQKMSRQRAQLAAMGITDEDEARFQGTDLHTTCVACFRVHGC